MFQPAMAKLKRFEEAIGRHRELDFRLLLCSGRVRTPQEVAIRRSKNRSGMQVGNDQWKMVENKSNADFDWQRQVSVLRKRAISQEETIWLTNVSEVRGDEPRPSQRGGYGDGLCMFDHDDMYISPVLVACSS